MIEHSLENMKFELFNEYPTIFYWYVLRLLKGGCCDKIINTNSFNNLCIKILIYVLIWPMHIALHYSTTSTRGGKLAGAGFIQRPSVYRWAGWWGSWTAQCSCVRSGWHRATRCAGRAPVEAPPKYSPRWSAHLVNQCSSCGTLLRVGCFNLSDLPNNIKPLRLRVGNVKEHKGECLIHVKL